MSNHGMIWSTKLCPRCGSHRDAIVKLGYSTFCSNCGGYGKVQLDGDRLTNAQVIWHEIKVAIWRYTAFVRWIWSHIHSKH